MKSEIICALIQACKLRVTCSYQALQTANSLAQYDANALRMTRDMQASIEVIADHLEQVVERKKVFVDYINSIKRETEEQRVLGQGNRRDRDLRYIQSEAWADLTFNSRSTFRRNPASKLS